MSTLVSEWAAYAERDWLPPEIRSHRWPSPGSMACEIALERANVQTPALELIDDVIVRVVENDGSKAMIFGPPQSGKTSRVRAGVLWALERYQSMRIAIVSSMSELSLDSGRQIKRNVLDNPTLGIALRADSTAAGRWETDRGGGVYCVGIGGQLTGKPVDLLVIDDPVKDRASAESETIRKATWEWWENIAKVRARRVILIQTRWHSDDLAGRLLEREAGQWDVLSLPAIAESPDDPLGREIGEELVTPVWSPGHYADLEKTTDEYVWLSLFQQRPTNAAGGIFKRGNWRYWSRGTANGELTLNLDAATWRISECHRFVTIDLASSVKRSADYTVAAAWAIAPSGDLVLLGLVRDRVIEIDHAAFVAPLRQRWLARYDTVYVEEMFKTTTLAHALGKANVSLATVKPDTDKLTRALPYAALVRQHKVWLPDESTADFDVAAFVTEHAEFTGHKDKHDDQVDNGSYATKIAVDYWLPPLDAATEKAYARSAADDIPDPMSMRW